MTTPDQLKDIVRYLQERVRLASPNERAVVFDPPTADEMAAHGLDEAAAKSMIEAPWWPEMVEDVVDTPDFADPADSAKVVLGYARDVIQEYVWKRFDLEG